MVENGANSVGKKPAHCRVCEPVENDELDGIGIGFKFRTDRLSRDPQAADHWTVEMRGWAGAAIASWRMAGRERRGATCLGPGWKQVYPAYIMYEQSGRGSVPERHIVFWVRV